MSTSIRNKLFFAAESFLRVPPLLVIDEVFRSSFGLGGWSFHNEESVGRSQSQGGGDDGGNYSQKGTWPKPNFLFLHQMNKILKEVWLWGVDVLQLTGLDPDPNATTTSGTGSSNYESNSIKELTDITDSISRDLVVFGHVIFSVLLFFSAIVMFMLATENLIKLYSHLISFFTLYVAYVMPQISLSGGLGGLFTISVNLTFRTLLLATFFLCRSWSKADLSRDRRSALVLIGDPVLFALFIVPAWFYIHPIIFIPIVLLLHHSLINSLPKVYNYLTFSWSETKRVQNEYGLSHLIQVESARLRVNTVFRMFWITRAAYDGFFQCCDEPFSGIIRSVMVHGTETFTGIVGLTVTIAAICHHIGDFLLWLLYLGGNSEVDLNRFGSISTVLFFILSLQSGLTSLDPEKRIDRLLKNIALLGTALFHALHQLVAPVLHAFRNFQAVQIRAAILSTVFLCVSLGLSITLYKWTTISTWSLAVYALIIEFKVKVIISLVISYVVYLSQLVQYPASVENTASFFRHILPGPVMHYFDRLHDELSHEDVVFYLKTLSNIVEFFTGIFLFFNAVWIFLFESTSAIRAIGMSIHAYFNIFCEAQKGIKILNQRRTASKKIMSLKDATSEQLKARNDDVCSICYESFESAKVTNCGHLFHAVCLRKWLYVQNTCPMCHEILYKEGDSDESPDGGVRRGDQNQTPEVPIIEAEGGTDNDDDANDNLYDLIDDDSDFVDVDEVDANRRQNDAHAEEGIEDNGRGLVLFL